MKKISLSLIGIAITILSFAQYPQVTIPGSEVRKITSKINEGQDYELDIMLPANFSKTGKKYPVVYLMDSQWDFPLAKCMYGEQYFDGFIPEMIIVGITWTGKYCNPDSLRVRDYTPTNDGREIQGGRADKFLDVIKNEVFPFVENNYNTDPKNRSLMGCSLGGLFTMYTLFTHSDMFTGYAAASPAIGWDKEILYKYEKAYFERKNNPPARLFITIGGVEKNVINFEKMADHLKRRAYPNIIMEAKVLENTGHSGTKSETYSRGAQFIFKKNDIKVDETILNKYVGSYQSEKGNKAEIRIENYQLVIAFSPANKTILKAESETKFYDLSQFFNLDFNDANSFQLNKYQNSEVYKK